MSNVASLPTVEQPAFHPANIFAHPGSSWGGAAAIVLAIGNQMQSQGMPTTVGGWIAFGLPILVGIGAALGK